MNYLDNLEFKGSIDFDMLGTINIALEATYNVTWMSVHTLPGKGVKVLASRGNMFVMEGQENREHENKMEFLEVKNKCVDDFSIPII